MPYAWHSGLMPRAARYSTAGLEALRLHGGETTHIANNMQWPSDLLLVRHGQSAGNLARERALAEDLATIDIAARDCDVPLSPLGEEQSDALGAWLGRNEAAPSIVFTSPYLRAVETAARVCKSAGWAVPVCADERLREKEFGMLDRLTRTGIRRHFPDQAEMLDRIGKFYYRPPGGESWTDVILRVRSFSDTLLHRYAAKRVAIVAHQVIVLCFRYIIENMTEARILAVDAAADIANCSLTTYRYDKARGALTLEGYNVVAPLLEAGEPLTRKPDVPVAPK
jgi:probable phosphoglycerate mutase